MDAPGESRHRFAHQRLTEGFFGLSFLFNSFILAIVIDATHYR
ncbi:hypothetical protein [Shewanella sp. SR44-3]|nr:hypothetical protein [Shewanella sp. SR44-3]